jgi:hypothetical protein
MNETATMEEVFGPVIWGYSRAQAIEDGVLVDLSEADGCKGHFKYPVAMTRAAWAATVEAGGKWKPDEEDKDGFFPDGSEQGESLHLPGGQSVSGRLHDVCTMLKATMRNPRLDPMQRQNTESDRVFFSVLVDVLGNGRKTRVELWSLCGPGDTAAPVLTIMLRGED